MYRAWLDLILRTKRGYLNRVQTTDVLDKIQTKSAGDQLAQKSIEFR